jgi:hypothetical protein
MIIVYSTLSSFYNCIFTDTDKALIKLLKSINVMVTFSEYD